MWNALVGGVLGALLVYFLDPEQGRRRRNVARDRLLASGRRGVERLTRFGRAAGAEAYGASQKLTHLHPDDQPSPNDVTLAQKVASEISRDPDVPKGRLNVNAEDGVVVLRGEVDRPEQIAAAEAAARQVPGVRDVRNLLHLPGTPIPDR
jgi:hypothetical protein